MGTSLKVWTHDDDVNDCALCKKAFSLFNRKHHCRLCGKVVCGGCSPHKGKVPEFKQPVRLCDLCHHGKSPMSPAKPSAASSAASSAPPSAHAGDEATVRLRACYDYVASNEGDLAFVFGDHILVAESTASSAEEWWHGTNERTGLKGDFPANHVEVVGSALMATSLYAHESTESDYLNFGEGVRVKVTDQSDPEW